MNQRLLHSCALPILLHLNSGDNIPILQIHIAKFQIGRQSFNHKERNIKCICYLPSAVRLYSTLSESLVIVLDRKCENNGGNQIRLYIVVPMIRVPDGLRDLYVGTIEHTKEYTKLWQRNREIFYWLERTTAVKMWLRAAKCVTGIVRKWKEDMQSLKPTDRMECSERHITANVHTSRKLKSTSESAR